MNSNTNTIKEISNNQHADIPVTKAENQEALEGDIKEVKKVDSLKYTKQVLSKQKVIQLNFGIFFDGTNCHLKDKLDHKKTNQKWDQLSNIGKLYYLYKSKNHTTSDTNTSYALYEPGVGVSTDYSHDLLNWWEIFTGAAFGNYAEERIQNTLNRISKIINHTMQLYSGDSINVILDVFGFSRGAALARHFCNMIHQKAFELLDNARTIDDNQFLIRFLGIFDTVSSFYYPGDNDDGDYIFHIDGTKVEHCYQITSQDEVRENFPLQSLQENSEQTLHTGNIIEESYPGVHSDIGGSYSSELKEHGRKNNDLGRIYLQKMFEKAVKHGVPFLNREERIKYIAQDKRKQKKKYIFLEAVGRFWEVQKTEEIKFLEELLEMYKTKVGFQKSHQELKNIQKYQYYATSYLKKYQKELKNVLHGDNKDHKRSELESEINIWKLRLDVANNNIITSKSWIKKTYFENQTEQANEFFKKYDQFYKTFTHVSHAPTNETTGMQPSLDHPLTALKRNIFYNSDKRKDEYMKQDIVLEKLFATTNIVNHEGENIPDETKNN